MSRKVFPYVDNGMLQILTGFTNFLHKIGVTNLWLSMSKLECQTGNKGKSAGANLNDLRVLL